ncbi:MAG: hypothetical protein QM820_13930 [Minicystis sp.]
MATVSLRSLGSTAVALGALLVTGAAAADEPAKVAGDASAAAATPRASAAPPADPSAWEKAPATRRSGFNLGAAMGFGLASIVGFPNDVKKIGYVPYYTATGARPTPVFEVWLGGALADWLNFGLGVTGNLVLATGDNKARSVAGIFHVEIFPLFHVSERLQDLGITIEAGTGVATVTSPKDEKLVDSSAASLVGGGVFWEPVRAWRFRGGPFLMGNYMWSDTARRPAIFAGFRMSLYSGPGSVTAAPTKVGRLGP